VKKTSGSTLHPDSGRRNVYLLYFIHDAIITQKTPVIIFIKTSVSISIEAADLLF